MTLSKKLLSKSFWRDPTRTKTVRDQYARKMKKLIRWYGKEAKEGLSQYRTYAGLPEPFQMDLQDYTDFLNGLNGSMLEQGQAIIDDTMPRVYNAGEDFANVVVGQISGVPGAMGAVDPRAIAAINTANLSAWDGISQEMKKQVLREISDGMRLGEGMAKITRRIDDRVKHIGLTRTDSMCRTEVVRAFNIGAEDRYKQYGATKLIWIATIGDERTCDECEARSGDIFEISSSHIRPPLHPQCRCSVAPADDIDREEIEFIKSRKKK